MTEVRLPVWYAHERGFPRYVEILSIGPASRNNATLVRMQHVVRGADVCKRCARNITQDASKLVGYGPDCCEIMGVARPTMENAQEVLAALTVKFAGTFEAWMPTYLVNRLLSVEQQDATPRFGAAGQPSATVARPATPTVVPPAPAKVQTGDIREITLDGDTIHFRFSYDAEVKDLIKAAGGRWDGVRGAYGAPSHWTSRVTPDASRAALLLISRHAFKTDPQVLVRLGGQPSVAAPKPAAMPSLAEDTKWQPKYQYLGTLRPYQRAGAEYMVRSARPFFGVYNGDVMGLGKTIETIVALHELQAYPAIVVSTASTKFNWQKEFRNWLGDRVTVSVLNGKPSTPVREADVVIVNYDILAKWMPVLTQLKAKAVVFDEAQKLKNSDLKKSEEPDATGAVKVKWSYKTQRVEQAAQLVKGIPLRFMLSGTAVKNRPGELVSQLDILGRLREMGGRTAFKDRYCAPVTRTSKGGRIVYDRSGRALVDYSGASNTAELNDRMRRSFYLRREREQVLKELPAKTRSFYEMALSNREEYDAAEEEIADAIEAGVRGAHLVRFSKLKQIAARGMLDGIREWVEDFFEQEDHLVMFAWHNEVADDFASAFKAPKIVGSTPLKTRQRTVDEFQAGEHPLLVANIQAGGEGITLTRAHHLAFTELAWTPADHDQAESREHRYGQTDPVTCHYFVAPETIYDDVMEILRNKWSVTDQVNIGNLAGYGLTDVEVKRKVAEKIVQRVARRRAAREEVAV